jgi:Peptidase A4 family
MKRFWAATAVLAISGLAWGASLPGANASVSARYGTPNPGGAIIRATAPGNATTVPTISLNWSGYAATSRKRFTYVNTQFVQPAITCTGIKYAYTSNWAGLDGYNDNTVEQDGTAAWCGENGRTAHYVAWYEMFPAASVNVFKVQPGDIIDASVRYASGTFTLTISDLTSGQTATDRATCSTCQRASAEWIVERPALCNAAETKCHLTPLADFDTSTMADDTARVARRAVKGIEHFTNTPIYMVDYVKPSDPADGFISLDAVTPLSGQSFTAIWQRSGKPTPITLGPDS